MRIFVAGATGALGRRLTPMLVSGGHHVIGTTRTAAKAAELRAAGVEPAVVDALDRDAVLAAVVAAKPDVIVHQMTALTGSPSLRKFDEFFTLTNRLRTEGTDHLLAAARAAGVRRFVAQSFTGWTNPRTGGPVKTEEDPLDPHPTGASRKTLAAIRHVEEAVTAADLEGVVLRYGGFYGPGNSLGEGGDLLETVRKRQLPVVGGGGGIWSLIHIDDAARATAQAIEGGPPGLYNIVDDEPAPVREWLPYLAQVIGAKAPRQIPTWLVRPLLGEHGISLMTQIRGSSNAKAKRHLPLNLHYPTWRQGFRDGLA